MKKVLFGVFAHPDDESFGPSASLYNEAQNGTDVHLVLVTDGEAGTNPDNIQNLGELRIKEWQESGKLIGAKTGTALHYPDGGLNNNLYLEIAEKISDFVNQTIDTYQEDIEIEFMTFENLGITGHLDHVAVSFITTFCYLKLREKPPKQVSVGKLKYYCLPLEASPRPATHWIYMPTGKKPENVDEVFDYSDLIDKKLEIMKAHYTQKADMQAVLSSLKNFENQDCRCDYFCYFKD